MDGGASANGFLMEFQADLLGAIVRRPEVVETTALGAAYLAGLATGYYENKDEIRKNWRCQKEIKPCMESETRERLLQEKGCGVYESISPIEDVIKRN